MAKKEKTVTTYICDVCGYTSEIKMHQFTMPMWFTTEQNEGKPVAPYLTHQDIYLCTHCIDKVILITGSGAQGNNEYRFKEDN